MAKKPTVVTTPYFRVSYPKVHKPELNELNGKMEYSIQALFSKGTDLTVLKKAAEAALEEAFGSDRKKWPNPSTFKNNPFRKMEDKVDMEKFPDTNGYPPGMEPGGIFMNFKSQQKPGLVDATGRSEIINPAEFYGGCFARAEVNAYYYDNKGNKGISFGLNHLQKWKDGDPFGSRTRAEDAFEAIETSGADAGGSDSAESLF